METKINNPIATEENTNFDSTEYFKEKIKESDVSSFEDSVAITSLLQARMNKENIDYYSKLPESMKREVNNIMLKTSGVDIPKQYKYTKNQVAKMILDEMIEDYNKSNEESEDLDSIIRELNSDLSKATDDMSKEFGDMIVSIDEDRKKAIEESIKKCEDEGNTEGAEKLKGIRDTIDSAAELTDFKEFCKTCKIKNYDIVKPKRIFDRFNQKYIDHKNNIYDIKICPNILCNHIKEYSLEQNMLVCLAFCKYCADKNPDDIRDHTFMYYFIRNIISIDRFNPRGASYETMNDSCKEFYDMFVANIKECIANLIERNSTLEINKK